MNAEPKIYTIPRHAVRKAALHARKVNSQGWLPVNIIDGVSGAVVDHRFYKRTIPARLHVSFVKYSSGQTSSLMFDVTR